MALPTLRSQTGLWLLLALVLPLLLWRAGMESSLWIDETYSVVLTTHPVPKLIELTAADRHPPLYYLFLKAWLKLGRSLELQGVFWARLSQVLLWLAGTLLAWCWGRRLFGEKAGALLTWATAGSAVAGVFARDLRSYGLAGLGLFLAFLCLVALRSWALIGAKRRLVLWSIFVAASSLAVWSHLLAALVAAVMVPLWLIGELSRAGTRLRPIVEAGAASLAVVLSFAPWLPRVSGQLAATQAGSTGWMTPPTVANLLLTFLYWQPLGRIGSLEEPMNRLLLPLGILAMAGPLAGAGWALRRGRAAPAPLTARLGGLGLGAAVAFCTLLWLLARLKLAFVFHGPRYPSLVALPLAAGLVGLALWAAERLQREALAPLLLAPWLAAGLAGQVYLGSKEASWGLGSQRAAMARLLPPVGGDLFVSPSELIPYYRHTLAEFTVHPIEDLACAPPPAGEATVLRLSSWRQLDQLRDLLLGTLLERGALAAAREGLDLPPSRKDYRIDRLRGLNSARLRALCASGFAPAGRGSWSTAVAVAAPEDQPLAGELSYLELDEELELYRWATAPRIDLRFDRALAAGSYRLHLAGLRLPHPTERAAVSLTLEGAGPAQSFELGPGRFEVVMEVRFDRQQRAPRLRVEHPTWKPAEVAGSADPRTLSFLVYGAWLEAGAG